MCEHIVIRRGGPHGGADDRGSPAALNQIKTTGAGGRGLAIAALIIGYVALVFGVIFFIVIMGAAASQYR